MISDRVITANLLNTHFYNIHQTVLVDKTITYTPSDYFITTIKNKLSNVEKFTIPLVSIEFVESQLKSLYTAKSTGVDNLYAKYQIPMPKISASLIALTITHMFNCSFNSNKFPEAFKIAKVIPIYKKRL